MFESRFVLECHDKYACGPNTFIWCPIDSESSCEFTCSGETSCFPPLYAYIDRGYNGITAEVDGALNALLVCNAETKASCTGYYGEDNNRCTDGQHCEISCFDNDGTGNNCGYEMIDASSALSLDIKCIYSEYVSLYPEACEFSTIRCPTANDANCTISCLDYGACQSLAVILDNADTHYNKLHINCTSGCDDMVVTVTVAEINNIIIECAACSNFVFALVADSTGPIAVDCGSCAFSSWRASVRNLENAIFACNGMNSCDESAIALSDAKELTLKCFANVCRVYTVWCT